MPDTQTPRIDLRLDVRKEGTIATVTVDNRAKLNTLGSALMTEFIATVDRLAPMEALRGLVLTGAGEKAFIGGADILEMARLDAAGARRFISLVHETCRSLRALPVPVIARIDGYALGAGLEIAAAADIRIASSRSSFGMPEVRVGIPSVVEAALLPQLIGWGRTRELLLFGETIFAETALGWGLVERVVRASDLEVAVESAIDALLKAGPRAIRLQKALISAWEELPVSQAIEAGIKVFAGAWDSDEPRRLMGEFASRKRWG
ncbi:MAG: enoyl-CoA hydratase/isomerase family protein [Proteobacteria bacterium]|nr:enoyl-CoA hydratase/isomerase family protein [Pseudomonadota bacterium]MBI3495845.1 enoyl-CoA hydratase/isomerase family protein [Pseudomonadota bacterium]